jgi:hypothetical protein
LVHVGGDFARDTSGAQVGRSVFKKGSISWAVDMPRSSCDHRALPPSGPPDGVCRCSLEGSASGPSPPAISSPKSPRLWWCRRSCLLLVVVRGVQPHGGWHSSAIARLQGFSSCSLAAISHQWSSRGMTTSLVVGRSKPGCGLPPALSFKDVHHPRWGGERAELGSCLPHGLAARFFLQHSGEKGVRQPCEEGELWVCGASRLRRRQLPRAWLLGLGGFGAASGAASCRFDGAWLSVHRTGDGCAVRRSATSTAFPAPSAAPGGRTRRRTPWGRRWLSWMVLSSLPQRGWERGPLRACWGSRRPSVKRWSLPLDGLMWTPPLVRLSTTEVVASTSEIVSATCCRTPDSLALMASLSPPVGRQGRGPFRSGVHVEVIAATGESSAQRRPSLLVLMWSPPLASRLELAIPWPNWCGGSSFLQGRDGTRAPLENRCNTFAFCKVLKSTH